MPPTLPRSTWAGALAGVLAGAVALAVGQLAAALSTGTPGPVAAVANRVRDASPGEFTRWGIRTFGTADKPLLLGGVVVVALALAVALGVASRRRPGIGVAGLVAFALFGVWALASEPGTDTATAAVILGAAGVAGVATLLGLLAVAPGGATTEPAPAPAGAAAADPRERRGNRRRFLVASGLVGAGAAATAMAGRNGSGGGSTEIARRAVDLPPADGARALRAEIDRAVDTPVANTPGVSDLITPNDEFYRIDTALFVPRVDPDDWQLEVTGMVRRPLRLTYADLVERSTTVAPLTLACVSNEVGGDLVGNAVWQGVPLAELLDEAGVDPAATQLVGRSVDGWTAGMPTAVAVDGRTALVAVSMNGEPLPVNHGFPARLVVAGLYGYVSATKWLRELELTTWEDFDAYWVPRGWAKEGPMKTQSRIDTPRPGRTVTAGPTAVAGVAWATDRGIEAVEVQVDDGPWQQAELGARLSEDTWIQWRLSWTAEPGRHRLRVRATDGTGSTQDEQRRPVAPDGATGWHTIEVDVA